SRRSHREWRIFFWFSLASAVVSSWFGISVRPPGGPISIAIVVSVVTSLIIATPIALLEVKRYRIPLLRRPGRLPLQAFAPPKVSSHPVVIGGGLMLSRFITQPLTGERPDADAVFRTSIVFSFTMALIANILIEMGGLLGYGTLKNLLTGRYVQP